MPSRRNDIRMSSEEEHEFLESQPFGVLGTIGPGSHPHLVTMGFANDGWDTIVATSFPAAQKVTNARRTSAASFLVEHVGPYSEIRGVLLRGTISVSDELRTVAHCYQLVRDRSTRLLEPGAAPAVDDEALIPKRVALIINVERRTSWDHRKLCGRY